MVAAHRASGEIRGIKDDDNAHNRTSTDRLAFLRDGDRVYHTYSTYGRGGDLLLGTYNWLDLTPFGRGEGWDGMPDLNGEGQFWTRHHDKYDGASKTCCGPEA